jgi:two-component system CheB/CheR fusion protein
MTTGGFSSFGQYLRHLRSHPDAYGRLIRSLLINVTDFFRDPPLYEYLRDEILPELLAHADAEAKELRFWSAGCATGEEAYSLAIMLAEVLGERLGEYHIRIFGTDLDEEAIAFARHGVYPASALDDVPADVVARYFTKHENGYEVKKHIRNLTVFGEHDLGQRAPFPRIDLCLCRNVLIYFTKELQQRTLQLFAFSLREGGYLVLGKAETTSPLPEYFKPIHRVFKVYQRHGPRVLIPPSRIRETTVTARERAAIPLLREGFNDFRSAATLPTIVGGGGRNDRGVGERPSPADQLASVLGDSTIGVVIVDRRYDIQAINQAARAFFNVHGIGVGEDLIHAITGIAASDLRSAIDAAFESELGNGPARREFTLVDPVTDASRNVVVTFTTQREDDRVTRVAMLVVEVTEHVEQLREAEAMIADLDRQNRDLADKNERLVARQRMLVAANDELTTANVELRNNNEHLLIAAEEAASAAEEIETLNEEMQATNEELETLNEELQATVEELNTTNDELEARSAEFQDLAAEREEQRVATAREREQLTAALDAIPTAVGIFDDHCRLIHANARYAALCGSDPPKLSRDGAVDVLRLASDGTVLDERRRIRLVDGSEAELRLRAHRFASDGMRGMVVALDPVGA